ncbi:IS4 family transposase [Butyrivibrio sp. WCD3002]|uniref:IS4 family transposase n=1 Tax=Butyrivibrio sp. WCD3002 TaxID=1280676 RepID=UPI000404ACDA|nr:IS4 family transposase [Butyrivibrio sp. WCD3002]
MEKHEICKLIIQKIKQYISSPDCLEAHREKNHFIRKRKLSMLHLVTYLFYTTKASMYQNLAAISEDLSPDNFPSVSKQAVSKARQHIKPQLFKELFNLSVDLFYKNIRKRKTWHGYHIFAIDGSRLEVPNCKSNFEFFGEMFTVHDKNRKFSSGLSSVVYDVMDDYIVHASLHKYLASERAAALDHMKNLEALGIYKDSIIIFDRGYYSESMFRYCTDNNHYCLMRLKEKIKLTRACHGEKVTTLAGDPKLKTCDIPIRVIEVILDDGTAEYLATNIFDESITVDMFRELYFLRWPVESKYYELKEKFLLEEFNGKTTTAVFQEFYINLLLTNLTALIKGSADNIIDTKMKNATKHRYQANRSFIIGRIKRIFPRILCSLTDISAIDDLTATSVKVKSMIQPGRKCKRRNLKQIRRKHFPNLKTAF